MNDTDVWDYLDGTSFLVTLGGKVKPYSKTIEHERWFMDKEVYQHLDHVRRMLFHVVMTDFLASDPDAPTSYRLNISIDKLEGGYYDKV